MRVAASADLIDDREYAAPGVAGRVRPSTRDPPRARARYAAVAGSGVAGGTELRRRRSAARSRQRSTST